MADEKKTRAGDRFPTLPADDPLFKGGFVIGSKRPGRAAYHGLVPVTDPRYQSGYNFLSGNSRRKISRIIAMLLKIKNPSYSHTKGRGELLNPPK